MKHGMNVDAKLQRLRQISAHSVKDQRPTENTYVTNYSSHNREKKSSIVGIISLCIPLGFFLVGVLLRSISWAPTTRFDMVLMAGLGLFAFGGIIAGIVLGIIGCSRDGRWWSILGLIANVLVLGYFIVLFVSR